MKVEWKQQHNTHKISCVTLQHRNTSKKFSFTGAALYYLCIKIPGNTVTTICLQGYEAYVNYSNSKWKRTTWSFFLYKLFNYWNTVTHEKHVLNLHLLRDISKCASAFHQHFMRRKILTLGISLKYMSNCTARQHRSGNSSFCLLCDG